MCKERIARQESEEDPGERPRPTGRDRPVGMSAAGYRRRRDPKASAELAAVRARPSGKRPTPDRPGTCHGCAWVWRRRRVRVRHGIHGKRGHDVNVRRRRRAAGAGARERRTWRRAVSSPREWPSDEGQCPMSLSRVPWLCLMQYRSSVGSRQRLMQTNCKKAGRKAGLESCDLHA